MKRTPVHIVTGFLGSGKTTFLNHFINQRLPERILVIENECGDTNVDGALIMDGVEEVVELSAGCLCCSLADGLLDILEAASKRQDQFDRMIIETTGIADPSSIIQIFLEEPRVEKFFDLQQVVCLADASQITNWLYEVDEALHQVALADVILINKIDTVNLVDLNMVQKLVEEINPFATVLSGQKGVFSINQIMEIGTINPYSVEAARNVENDYHEHETKGKNKHKITTFTFTFPMPIDLNHLIAELNTLVNDNRYQLYRIKGFIAIPNYPNRVILQSARSVLIATDGSPWEMPEEVGRIGKLVFIGKDLKRSEFEEIFHDYLIPYH